MLRRGVETYIGKRYTGTERDTERLDAAIDVLVIDGVFLMPNTGRRVCDLVGDRPDTVNAGFGNEL